MADPVANPHPNLSNFPDDHRAQKLPPLLPPGVAAHSSSSSYLALANDETNGPASVSTPMQLTGVSTSASVSKDAQALELQARELINAAGEGDLVKVKQMLEAGMPIDTYADGLYAITKAADQGQSKLVTFLTESGACDKSRSIATAAALNSCYGGGNEVNAKEIAKYLILSFPVGDARKTALTKAASGVCDASLLNKVSREAEIEEFQSAAKAGDVAKLKAHIAAGMKVGAQVTERTPTALVEAARKLHVDAVKYLLTQGPSETDKKDALMSIAYELERCSAERQESRPMTIAKSILNSAADSKRLLMDFFHLLQARGEMEVAYRIWKLNLC